MTTLHELEERILRLEKQNRELKRARKGLIVEPALNILGQNTRIDGNLYLGGNAVGVWQDWPLSATGWAAGYTGFVRYTTVGKICHMIIDINGTSNSTTATLNSLPFNVSASGGLLYFQIPNVTDNGTQIITGGRSFAQVRPAGETPSNVIWFWLDGSNAGWTASGTKRVRVALFYEIA